MRASLFVTVSDMAPKHKPELSRLQGEAQQRIRALKMLEYRIMHRATYRDIAEKFALSEKTVERALSWVQRAGLMVELEDKLLQNLAPLAVDAVKRGLADEEHSQEAAKLGLELLKAIAPSMKKSQPLVTSTQDDLTRHVEQLRQGLVEGTVIPALPATETVTSEEGTHVPTDRDGDDEILQAARAESVGIPRDESGSEGA